MSRRKLPPRLYLDEARGKWVIRFDGWNRRTPYGRDEKEAAQAMLDKILGDKCWAHAVRSLRPKPRKQAPPPWARSETEGLIYFVSATDDEYQIKIGFCAGDMSKRLAELQIGNPVLLVILATHPGTYAQEQAVHAKLANVRMIGEWFERSDGVMLALQAARGGVLHGWLAINGTSRLCTETAPTVEISE